MKTNSVAELLQSDLFLQEVSLKGWVRTFRSNRFIAVNDGSTIKNIQCVVDFENTNEELLKRITTGASVSISGTLIESQGKGQTVEIQVSEIEILGDSNPEEYPIQPKKHSLEFLRENAHLRVRTNTFSAVMRVRSALSFAVHKYFQQNGFNYVNTPIITGSDAEGGGEMFHVSALNAKNPPLSNEKIDSLGLKFYSSLLEVLGNTEKIDQKISKYIEGYDFKKIVLARPSEINKIISDKKNSKELKDIFKKIYKDKKRQIFDVTEGKAYMKSWLFQELTKDNIIPCRKKQKSFQVSYDKTITDYGHTFCFSIYNFKRVFEYNQLSGNSRLDYKLDFFGKETNLTVSGQLEAETYAMALGKVYTFGPTFRAENSNTTRHLAEFWMIEPEVAFMDLDGNMDLSEDFIKSVLKDILETCKDDLEFLDQRLNQEEKSKPQIERSEMSLLEKLHFVVDNNFKRVSYTEAIDILRNSKSNKKKKFQYPINEWGADLQSEHERFLVEKHFKRPVILFDYPASIKAFYMRLNDDRKTVRAMDVLFPGIGEIAGGSQREERFDVLKEKIQAMGIDEKELWWYLDLRKFGTAVHSGFGLGFERLVQFTTGMGNIRDVIPFPRTPQNAEF